jgi:hypothetical protein
MGFSNFNNGVRLFLLEMSSWRFSLNISSSRLKGDVGLLSLPLMEAGSLNGIPTFFKQVYPINGVFLPSESFRI